MIDARLQKTANKTAKAISEFLRLPEPEKYEIRLLEENDVEGSVQLSEDKDHPLIICRISDEPLSMFTVIGHELRHIYQMLYHEKEYFANYTLDKMHDMNAYNEQPAEIDANAFTCFLCETVFNVGCPPIEGCSKTVYKKIEKRAIELFHEYYADTEFDYLKRRLQNNAVFDIYRESAKKYQ